MTASTQPAMAWGLEQFFNEFYPKIHRFVSIVSAARPEEVDDLVQESLLAAWRDRHSFRADSSIDAWILSIARNHVRRRFRTESRRKELREAHAVMESFESREIPEDVLGSRETGRRVRQALDRLDPAYAEVLMMKYLDGRTVAWIAEQLGDSEKAVESRLSRAKEELRTLLKGMSHDESF